MSKIVSDLKTNMECRERLMKHCQLSLLRAQLHLQEADANLHEYAVKRQRRRRRQRTVWVRTWLGPERRRQFGLYDQLMVELRREDEKSFINFMRMPPEMFDEILDRVGPRITKPTTHFRAALEPGLKLAIILRHLASGSVVR